MNRPIKIVLGISALVALWTLNLAFEVFPRVSAEQKHAIAVLSKPALLGQRNGWSAVLELAGHPEFGGQLGETCDANDDCLTRVAAELPAMQQRARDAAPMIALQKTLYRFDHFAMQDIPNLLEAIFSALTFGELLTAITTQAVGGEPQAAVHELCEFAQFSRSMTRTNSLLMLLLGETYLSRSISLMAELQSHYRVVLDTQCLQAFTPLCDIDHQFCEAVKGEFMFYRQLINGFELGHAPSYLPQRSKTGAWLYGVGLNATHTKALFAGKFMPFCAEVPVQNPGRYCNWVEYASNPIGCNLFQESQENQENIEVFRNRLHDLQQKLALFRLSQFARSTGAQACAERLDCGPEGALAGLIHDSSQGTISIALLQPRADQAKLWTLTLR